MFKFGVLASSIVNVKPCSKGIDKVCDIMK